MYSYRTTTIHRSTRPKFARRRRRASAAPFVVIFALVFFEAARLIGIGHISAARASNSEIVRARFTICNRHYQSNCVIDGDTIHYNGARIRVEDIDAPETHAPSCASEAARGERATERLLALVNAGPFEIVYTGGRNKDVYGRELRRLERGGQSLGAELVSEGLARNWDGARHPWC